MAQDAIWGRMLPGIERITKLQADLKSSLPDALGQRVRIAALTEDALVISVSSTSLATKVRQILPRIRAGLESRGWKVSAIQLRVQPDDLQMKSDTYGKKTKKSVVTPEAQAAISRLAETLQEGDLRAALKRLLAHAQRAPAP